MSLRDIRDAARGSLHKAMSFAAFVYADGASSPICSARVRRHTRRQPVGDLPGASYHPAERLEENPKIVFDVREHTPKRGHIVILEDGTGFRVDTVEPADGMTQTTVCVSLKASEVEDYGLPDPA